MNVKNLNNMNFAAEIRNSDTVLVDFYAEWCGPCKMMAPIMEELAEEHEDIVVAKINVDDSAEIAMRYGVSSIPTIILFKNGVEASRVIGYRPKSEIEKMIP